MANDQMTINEIWNELDTIESFLNEQVAEKLGLFTKKTGIIVDLVSIDVTGIMRSDHRLPIMYNVRTRFHPAWRPER